MEKITYPELKRRFQEFNRQNKITCKGTGKEIKGVVVLAPSNWSDVHLSLKERSYLVSSDNKAFIDGQLGYSIFAHSLDGSDYCRLEDYIEEERGPFKVDYCYMIEDGQELPLKLL